MNPVVGHGLATVGTTVPVNRKSLFELPRHPAGEFLICIIVSPIDGTNINKNATRIKTLWDSGVAT